MNHFSYSRRERGVVFDKHVSTLGHPCSIEKTVDLGSALPRRSVLGAGVAHLEKRGIRSRIGFIERVDQGAEGGTTCEKEVRGEVATSNVFA